MLYILQAIFYILLFHEKRKIYAEQFEKIAAKLYRYRHYPVTAGGCFIPNR
jgi:hypothetical protein